MTNTSEFEDLRTTTHAFMSMVDSVVATEVQVLQLYTLRGHRGVGDAGVDLAYHLSPEARCLIHLS